jgi:exonuclease SbcC
MRILATGDQHIGLTSRASEEQKARAWLVAQARETRPDVILSGGDLYHKTASPELVEQASQFVQELADISHVVLARGNHDALWSVGHFSRLRSRFPIVACETPQVVRIGSLGVAVLPWPAGGQLLAQMGDITSDDSRQIGVASLRNILRHLALELEESELRVVLAHATICGAKLGSERSLVGLDWELSPADLAVMHAQITLCSHIHLRQRFWDGDNPGWYLGTTYYVDHGDAGEKGAALVTLEPNQPAQIEWLNRTDAERLLTHEDEWLPEHGCFQADASDFLTNGFGELDPNRVKNHTIKFRYTVTEDQVAAAAAKADALCRELVEWGANSATPEPVVESRVHARVPEVSTAETLADQLGAYWNADADSYPPELRTALLACLAELEHQNPRPPSAALRLESVRIRGLGEIDDLSIDLRTLPETAKLVAIHGPNGSGKSSALELWSGGALYRECATRGSLKELAEWAGRKDGLLEASFWCGQHYRVRHIVDGVTGTQKSVAMDEAGEVFGATRDGLVSAYDAWAAATFPPPEVIYSSSVAVQRGDGLLDPGLTKGDRKRILARALGVEHFEVLAKAAKKSAETAGAAAREVEIRLEVERERAGDAAEAEKAVVLANEAVLAARPPVDAARAALSAGEQALRDYDAAQDAYIRAVGERGRLESEVRKRSAEVAALDAQIAGAQAILGQKDAILGAAVRSADLSRTISELQAKQASLTAEQTALEREARSLDAQAAEATQRCREALVRAERSRAQLTRKDDVDQAQAAIVGLEIAVGVAVDRLSVAQTAKESAEMLARQMADLEAQAQADERLIGPAQYRMEQAQEWLAGRPRVEAAEAEIPVLTAKVAEFRGQLDTAHHELERLRGQRVAGAEERIGYLRGGLETIREYKDGQVRVLDPWFIAEDTIVSDDSAARMATELPAATDLQSLEVTRLRDALRDAQAKLVTAENTARGRADIPRYEASLAEARAEWQGAQERAKAARAKVAEASAPAKLQASQKVVADAQADLDGCRQRLAHARETAALAESMAQAEASLVAARAETEQHAEQAAALKEKGEQVGLRAGALSVAIEEIEDQQSTAESEIVGLGDLLDQVEPLAAAEGVVATCQTHRETAAGARARLEAELSGLPVPCEPAPVKVDIGALRVALQAAEEQVLQAERAASVAQSKLDTALESRGRLDSLTAEADGLRIRQSNWTRLSRDLGPDGLQAAVIEAATPTMNRLANSLLHDCTGTRFTLDFRTTRSDAKGKKTLEDCDVVAFDSRRGKAKLAKRLSGGELALVSLAVFGAMCEISCNRQGIRGVTLVRDESGSALDSEKAPQYVAMLRRLAERIQADRVLLVSHVPEMVALCDVRAEMGGGSGRVMAADDVAEAAE